MATTYLGDVRKIRFLPLKQVSIKLANNDIYIFSDVQEGVNFDLEPITATDSAGSDIVMAYRANVEFTLTQNNFKDLSTYFQNINNDTAIKGFALWFNRNMAINSTASGEQLTFVNYDETTFNYQTSAIVSYNYDNDMPVAKIKIKSLMTIAQANLIWTQISWASYTWT